MEGLGYNQEQQIMEIKNAIFYHIRINIETNPIYETLSQKLERILKEKEGKFLLNSLKKLIQEINEIEEKAERLALSREEYALFEVLRKHIPDISDKEGATFVRELFTVIRPEMFPNWQEKKQVVQEIERKVFDKCLDRFEEKIGKREILSMAEQMVEYSKRF